MHTQSWYILLHTYSILWLLLLLHIVEIQLKLIQPTDDATFVLSHRFPVKRKCTVSSEEKNPKHKSPPSVFVPHGLCLVKLPYFCTYFVFFPPLVSVSFSSLLRLVTPAWDPWVFQWVCEVWFSWNPACHYCSVPRDASHCGGPSHPGKGSSRWRDAFLWCVLWVCAHHMHYCSDSAKVHTQRLWVIIFLRDWHTNSLCDCYNGHCW